MDFTALLDFFFPSQCVACGRFGDAFCVRCVPAGAPEMFAVDRIPCVALGPYAGDLRKAILSFKRGRRDVGQCFARLASQRLPIDARAGALVPVPTIARRKRERGFDQAMLLARGLGDARGVPVLALLRPIATDSQRGRNRATRLQASGRFALTSMTVAAGLNIVLVDDVATTGATIRDCASALERGGVRTLGAIVIAHARE